jgi:hypothetical protein
VGAITDSNGAIGLTGLAFSPLTGVLYGITANGVSSIDPHSLVTIDPATANAVLVGNLGMAVSDISFNSAGVLFGWKANGGPLVTINLSTGASSTVGVGALSGGTGLAFTPDGTLYLAGSVSGSLFTVDSSTGVKTGIATLSGGTLANFNSLASDFGGVLYGVETNIGGPASTLLATINQSTGAITTIGSLPNDTDGIAFNVGSVPEPASYALLFGASAAGVILLRRRRQQ